MLAGRPVKAVSERKKKVKRGLGWGLPKHRSSPEEWAEWDEEPEDSVAEDEPQTQANLPPVDEEDNLNEYLQFFPPQEEDIKDYVDTRAAKSGHVFRRQSIVESERRKAEEAKELAEAPDEDFLVKDYIPLGVEEEAEEEEEEQEEKEIWPLLPEPEPSSETESTEDKQESPEELPEEDSELQEPIPEEEFGGARPKDSLRPPSDTSSESWPPSSGRTSPPIVRSWLGPPEPAPAKPGRFGGARPKDSLRPPSDTSSESWPPSSGRTSPPSIVRSWLGPPEPAPAKPGRFGGARPKDSLRPPSDVSVKPLPASSVRSLPPSSFQPAPRPFPPPPLPRPPLPPSQRMRWQAPPPQQQVPPGYGMQGDILQLLPQFLPQPLAMLVQMLLKEYKERAEHAENQHLGAGNIMQAIEALNNNTKILIGLNRRGGDSSGGPGGYCDNMNQISYPDQQPVEIKMVFVRVMDIDTISQQFDAEIYIQARWAESQFAGMSEKDLESVDFCQCWDPRLKILNAIGAYDSEKTSMLLRYEEDRVYPVLTYMWHVRGLFREHLELQHFPFDVQELSIILTTERPVNQMELVEDFYHPSSVNSRALEESQDWTSYRHVEFTRDFTTKELVGTTKHPVLVAAAHVKRKLGFYMWNVALIVLLILCLSLTVLSIDPTGTDRLGVTVTLFLTAVAFKLVVKTTLPTISYLTYLDIYVVFTLIYLSLQAAENAFMTHLARHNDRDLVLMYDEIAQSLLIALLILFHLAFIIYIQLTALQRRRDMSKKDHDFLMAKLNRKKARGQQMAETRAAPQEDERSSLDKAEPEPEPGPEEPLYPGVATQTNGTEFQ